MKLIVYYLIINFLTFIAYWDDKQKAKKNGWRIPESTLLLMALLGGGPGAYIAMQKFRHKTKHKKFTILVPTCIIIHIILIFLIIIKNIL